jgi:hypothetical protein
MFRRTFTLLFALLCLGTGAASSQEKKDSSKPEMLEMAGGKILAEKPEAWKTVATKSSMIQYEFRTPAEGDKSARITIMQSGGGIEPNIARWIGQFPGTKKEDVKVEKKTVDQTTVHMVEIAGTFNDSMGMPGGPIKKMENYKMLGAILELKDGTTIFVKATGPADIVGGMRDGWMKMLDGIKNK